MGKQQVHRNESGKSGHFSNPVGSPQVQYRKTGKLNRSAVSVYRNGRGKGKYPVTITLS